MITDRAILSEAEYLLETEWSAAYQGLSDSRAKCPLAHLLPRMLEMVEAHHDHTVPDCAPAVRALIAEAVFDDTGPNHGHPTERDEAGCVQIERQVQIFLRVLERLRRSAVRTGQWSDLPVTPQMFG